jgi:hypothetical protein
MRKTQFLDNFVVFLNIIEAIIRFLLGTFSKIRPKSSYRADNFKPSQNSWTSTPVNARKYFRKNPPIFLFFQRLQSDVKFLFNFGNVGNLSILTNLFLLLHCFR